LLLLRLASLGLFLSRTLLLSAGLLPHLLMLAADLLLLAAHPLESFLVSEDSPLTKLGQLLNGRIKHPALHLGVQIVRDDKPQLVIQKRYAVVRGRALCLGLHILADYPMKELQSF